MSNSSNPNHPSLVGGHAQFIKGATEEVIGSVTGSEPWKRSGLQDKEEGINIMKAASANRNSQESGFGKAEELAGKAVGCEGMQNEGQESQSNQ